jgi:membrane fusion protein, multidrug efflux system
VKRLLKPTLTLAIVAGVMALAVWGFVEGKRELEMERERERPVKAPIRVFVADGQPVVIFDQVARQKAGLIVATLKSVSRRQENEAFGVVISAQELVGLRNQYVAAKPALAKAQVNVAVARKEYERARALHDADRNVSDKIYQAAEAAWRAEQTAISTAKNTLVAIESTARQQWGGSLGRAIIEGSPLYARLAELKDVLVQVTLPIGVEFSEPPQTIKVKTPDGAPKEATLISSAPRTDARIQGMSFYYRAPAVGLFPGMNLQALLPASNEQSGVLIPSSAIVSWQGKSWAYAQETPDRFVRRELVADTPADEGWFVPQGFKAGEQVVLRGAQLLLSEELRAQIQVGEDDKK